MSVILFLNFVLSTNNEGYKYKKAAKGDYDYDYDEDAETVVYDFEEDEDAETVVYDFEEDQRKGFYMYFDESEIFKYTGESKSESKKLDSISTDDLYNELCVRMSERDELVVLLSVDKYKSLLDFERERKEFEEYKKAEMEKEMEKLVREKERERKEFEEYKKAEMEKEMEKLSIELKKEKETFVNDISLELYKYENKPAERIPEEFLKTVPCMIPSTDDLYPVLYFKSHIQTERSPTDLYLHTLYYNTGARLDINVSHNNNWENVSIGCYSNRTPPYIHEAGIKIIESLKQYKDKYIFTQNMVDIIYKTFGGDKTTFILSKHYLRRDQYWACQNENDVDRLINTLKVLQREREEYSLKLRTLV